MASNLNLLTVFFFGNALILWQGHIASIYSKFLIVRVIYDTCWNLLPVRSIDSCILIYADCAPQIKTFGIDIGRWPEQTKSHFAFDVLRTFNSFHRYLVIHFFFAAPLHFNEISNINFFFFKQTRLISSHQMPAVCWCILLLCIVRVQPIVCWTAGPCTVSKFIRNAPSIPHCES
jgi:hypothetical protein